MSERYTRPHTPPGPPPNLGSRKPSSRGSGSNSSSSTKPVQASKSYDNLSYNKSYPKSSAPYPANKTSYSDSKYKNESSRKGNEKAGSSTKYGGKTDTYASSDLYSKPREVKYPSDRYADRDRLYSTRYPDKGTKYPDKSYPTTLPQEDKYPGKKYPLDDPYMDKGNRYTRPDTMAYYGTGLNYPAYDSYRPDRLDSNYTDKHLNDYGGRGGMGAYTDCYGAYDKLGRSAGYGSGDKLRGGLYPRDKLGVGGYSDDKLVPRGRLGYPDDDRRPYPDYPAPRTARSPLRGGGGVGLGGGYSEYDAYAQGRSPKRPYLDRYVIGDSVVYGSPGHYPRDLRSVSPRPRPPSPPSPQPLLSLFPTYPPNARARRRSPITQTSSQYRPPSPPTRRPPSPKSPYHRAQSRTSQDMTSFERDRSKDRYGSGKNRASRTRSPLHDRSLSTRRTTDQTRGGRGDKRKEPDRAMESRDRGQDNSDTNKRVRGTDTHTSHASHATSDYRNNSWAWDKDNNNTSSKDRGRYDRRSYPVPSRSSGGRVDAPRDRSRDDGRSEGDRSRRLEDRLGPTPSQTNRTPLLLGRLPQRQSSPRDKRSRRPDDLRLWIESRKSEGVKRGASPGTRTRGGTGTKRTARSSERAALPKRSRLGDAKRRLGGSYKARRRTLPVKRNNIVKKYNRLMRRRGPKSGGGGGGRSNKEGGGSSRGGGGGGDDDDDDKGDENKPGSSASIRRVVKKPKKMSHVNRLALKPRVIRVPTQKLLKDPKEMDSVKETPPSPQPAKVKEEVRDPEDKDTSTSDNKKQDS